MYKATVYCEEGSMEYICSTGVSYKRRFNQHSHSMNSSSKESQTALSKLVNKNKSIISEVKWSIVYRVKDNEPSKPGNCSICNLERMAIELNH